MSAPWPYGPKRFDVPVGGAALIQLNVPQRGTIRNFKLQAPGGESGSFELFTNLEAATVRVGEVNGSSSSMSSGLSPEAFKFYEGSLTSGVFSEHGIFVPYCNTDGGPSNRDGRLWMCLEVPAGAGTIEYLIAMTIAGPDF